MSHLQGQSCFPDAARSGGSKQATIRILEGAASHFSQLQRTVSQFISQSSVVFSWPSGGAVDRREIPQRRRSHCPGDFAAQENDAKRVLKIAPLDSGRATRFRD